MAKTRKGDVFSCQICGIVCVIDAACGCATCDIMCCGQPMAKGKAAAGKAREKAAELTATKRAKAASKPAAKKAPAKKPAAKAKKK